MTEFPDDPEVCVSLETIYLSLFVQSNVDLHVVPAVGRRPLAKLTPTNLDLFHATRSPQGRLASSPPEIDR